MSWGTAREIVDLCHSIGVDTILLIGGEPTFWPHLHRAIRYISDKGMRSTLVTNGYLFAYDDFFHKIQNSPVDAISLSLKAGSDEQYRRLAKVDAASHIAAAIKKLSASNIDTDVSITISSLVSGDLVDMVKFVSDNGGKSVSLDFCSPVFAQNTPKQGYALSPGKYVDVITSAYPSLDNISVELWLEQSLPRCVWPHGFLEYLEEKGQVGSGCHVRNRSGVIFDSAGNVIPCNCLPGIIFGKYGGEFLDAISFQQFWDKKKLADFYQRLFAYPAHDCVECSDYKDCGGGCPLNWFVFDPEQEIRART
jgi:radical SAM protein with 4Fe4S-binding SPASM domain